MGRLCCVFPRSESFITNANAHTWSHVTCQFFLTWQSMLRPFFYLHIGGFNVCSPGMLLELAAWAVHDIYTWNQNFMRIAGTQAVDRGETQLWMTSCGTHIWIHVACLSKFENWQANLILAGSRAFLARNTSLKRFFQVHHSFEQVQALHDPVTSYFILARADTLEQRTCLVVFTIYT